MVLDTPIVIGDQPLKQKRLPLSANNFTNLANIERKGKGCKNGWRRLWHMPSWVNVVEVNAFWLDFLTDIQKCSGINYNEVKMDDGSNKNINYKKPFAQKIWWDIS